MKKGNGLKKAVEKECGYWRSGRCIGIEEGDCLIIEGRKCGWFQEAILPVFAELEKEYRELEE